MPIRGLFIVALLFLAAVGAWFFFGQGDGGNIKDANLSENITPGSTEPMGPMQAEQLIPPTFDIVRVERSGEAVIAGRSAPGANVEILSNGEVIGSAIANDRGEWVVIPDEALPTGPQELTIRSKTKSQEAVESIQSVVIDVPERRDALPLIVLAEPGQASRILQRPDSLASDDLSIEIVDYDENGEVIISGRAEPGSLVRIYLDNESIGVAETDAEGIWVFRPEGIEPGTYTLRVDQLGPSGIVTARIEVPFERASPEQVKAAMAAGGGSVVVQPGNSLWRIARRVYGSGVRYTIIFSANQGKIRDPDLIYPGQVLELPEVSSEE